jgi:hypothetical protein
VAALADAATANAEVMEEELLHHQVRAQRAKCRLTRRGTILLVRLCCWFLFDYGVVEGVVLMPEDQCSCLRISSLRSLACLWLTSAPLTPPPQPRQEERAAENSEAVAAASAISLPPSGAEGTQPSASSTWRGPAEEEETSEAASSGSAAAAGSPPAPRTPLVQPLPPALPDVVDALAPLRDFASEVASGVGGEHAGVSGSAARWNSLRQGFTPAPQPLLPHATTHMFL